MSVTFCCHINDVCALVWPRQFRDQCTPDLLTLRDAYKSDLVIPYPGLAPGDIEWRDVTRLSSSSASGQRIT